MASWNLTATNGDEGNGIYMQVDWHRYPGQEMKEKRRFCARWRRENATERYGEDFFMLDADGPGQLVGFIYGVRLIDNTDRWSHGGAENIYLNGEGDYPAYIRGIGGEDTFGTSYGGAQHPPETHLYAGMPYYVHEDVGEARPAQRLVGYRFFVKDSIPFEKSIHMRFGCMENDICSTVYWYQAGEVRPISKLPPFAKLLAGTPLKRGEMDLPLPNAGSWRVAGPFENAHSQAITAAAQGAALPNNVKWIERPSYHGFVDFNHAFRPHARGVGIHYRGKAAVAQCVLNAPEDTTATLRFAWDDDLVVRINDQPPVKMGQHPMFRQRSVEVPLKKGRNVLRATLSNNQGTNHGGWTFAMKATTADGTVLQPDVE